MSVPGSVRVTPQGGYTTLITLGGRIDERTPLGGIADKIATTDVAIDTADVTFINSLGLREWIKLLRELSAKKLSVVLRRCSDTMVAQMNMVNDAAIGVVIESMQLPYACDKCGHEGPVLIDVKQHGNELRQMHPPSAPCPECKSPMTFAEVPEHYLFFFTKTR
jgi:anti-anti-sigma regulatory factor